MNNPVPNVGRTMYDRIRPQASFDVTPIDGFGNVDAKHIAIDPPAYSSRSLVKIFITCTYFTAWIVLVLLDNISPQAASQCPLIPASPLYAAFESNDHYYILAACVATVTVALEMSIHLVLDVVSKAEKEIDDTWERFQIVVLTFLPLHFLVMFFNNQKDDLPYYFSMLNGVQFIGHFGVVLNILHMLYPTDFGGYTLAYLIITMSIGVVVSVAGFCQPFLYWTNISALCSTALVIIPLFYTIYCWMAKQHLFRRLLKGEMQSAREIYCLTYVLALVIVLAVASSIVMSRFLTFSMLSMDAAEASAYIYSVALFAVIVGVYPGRSSLHLLMDSRRELLATKTTLIRFMSHEVRTPLTIVQSCMEFLEDDFLNALSRTSPMTEEEIKGMLRKSVDMLEDGNYACASAIGILNTMLAFESLHKQGGKLNLTCAYVPISATLKQLTKRLAMSAQRSKLNLRFHDHLCPEASLQSPDTAQITTLFALLDVYHFEQVIRNVLMNAITFTPPGGSIDVSIRKVQNSMEEDRLVAASHSAVDRIHRSLTSTYGYYSAGQAAAMPTTSTAHGNGGWQQDPRLTGAIAPLALNIIAGGGEESALDADVTSVGIPITANTNAFNDHDSPVHPRGWTPQGRFLIEISDTGAGIEQKDFPHVFEEFTHLGTLALQGERTARGAGLGLWMARTVVGLHGGSISFRSPGLNQGTVFSIVLDCYSEVPVQPQSRPDPINTQYADLSQRRKASMTNVWKTADINQHTNGKDESHTAPIAPSCKVDIDSLREPTRVPSASHAYAHARLPMSDPLIQDPRERSSHQSSSRIMITADINSDSKEPSLLAVPAIVNTDHHAVVHDDSKKPVYFTVFVVDDSSTCRKVVKELFKRLFNASELAQRRGWKLLLMEAEDGLGAINATRKAMQANKGLAAISRVNSATSMGDSETEMAFLADHTEGLILSPSTAGLIRAKPPSEIDLIIMDYTMLHCHGPEAVAAIRQMGFTNSVYGLTGNVMQTDIDDYVKAGANLVIGKPVSRAQAKQLLDKELDAKAMRLGLLE